MFFIATSGSLGMAALSAVSEYFKDVNREEVIRLGLALGLLYSRLEGMKMFPEDVIAAWLRGDDQCGPPSWTSLATALERTGHTVIASKVRKGDVSTDKITNT